MLEHSTHIIADLSPPLADSAPGTSMLFRVVEEESDAIVSVDLPQLFQMLNMSLPALSSSIDNGVTLGNTEAFWLAVVAHAWEVEQLHRHKSLLRQVWQTTTRGVNLAEEDLQGQVCSSSTTRRFCLVYHAYQPIEKPVHTSTPPSPQHLHFRCRSTVPRRPFWQFCSCVVCIRMDVIACDVELLIEDLVREQCPINSQRPSGENGQTSYTYRWYDKLLMERASQSNSHVTYNYISLWLQRKRHDIRIRSCLFAAPVIRTFSGLHMTGKVSNSMATSDASGRLDSMRNMDSDIGSSLRFVSSLCQKQMSISRVMNRPREGNRLRHKLWQALLLQARPRWRPMRPVTEFVQEAF
ncbi:hypothetical protein KC361_g97 [Hortaea werneckii]|nr:hypothetical protein KC361_g97 [Hortaea werneckii]